MARKWAKSTKNKQNFDPKNHKQNFKLNKSDAEPPKKELSQEFSVNDELIKCIEHCGKSLFGASLMNAHLVSCMNKNPKKGKTGGAHQTNANVPDKRGMHQCMSALVQDNGWRSKKTTDENAKSKKGTKKRKKMRMTVN